jgi:hypothetical protein
MNVRAGNGGHLDYAAWRQILAIAKGAIWMILYGLRGREIWILKRRM